MKISELITILQQKDPNLLVMVQGYEGGLTDIAAETICESEAYLGGYFPKREHYGDHNERFNGCDEYYKQEEKEKEYREKYPLVQALIFRR